MADELQGLIDTIQKEGVEKAQSEADKIIQEAQQKARQTVADAEKEAESIRAKAKDDAKATAEQGTQALRQAARDMLLAVAQSVQDLLRSMVVGEVNKSLDGDTLKEILKNITDTYFAKVAEHKPVDIYINPEDQKALAGFFRSRLREKFKEGLEVHPDDHISKGFRVALQGEDYYHDLTQESLAEELCRYLRPELQEHVRAVVEGKSESN